MNIKTDWEIAFESFRKQPVEIQQVLRRSAADELVYRGASEVGTSDINHELFSFWQSNNRDWTDAFMDCFHRFAERN